MNTISQELDFNKSTKGTHQFTAQNHEGKVTTSIYIKKEVMPNPPKRLRVDVVWSPEE